jgi:DNA invertase Pin-like site-specific DNA recombinase
MDAFAELERKMVAKRLRDGRLAKAAAGRKAVGDYPFGYAATGKGRERDARPIEAEQKAVARIVELRRAGRSCREIATTLDAGGHKLRRAASWSAAAVHNVAPRETPGAKLTAEQRSRQARKAARSR